LDVNERYGDPLIEEKTQGTEFRQQFLFYLTMWERRIMNPSTEDAMTMALFWFALHEWITSSLDIEEIRP